MVQIKYLTDSRRILYSLAKSSQLVTGRPFHTTPFISMVNSNVTSNIDNSKTNRLEDSSIDDEYLHFQQQQANNQIKNELNEILSTPKETILNRLKMLDLEGDLTAKELELENELAMLYRDFSKNNKLLPSKETIDIIQNVDSISAPIVDLNNSNKGQSFPFLIPTSTDKPYSKEELFLRQLNHSKKMAKLGANIKNVYFPYRDINKPLAIDSISLKNLHLANCHLGQSISLYNPLMQQFILGEYKNLHMIDLNKTLSYLKRAAKVVEKVIYNNGIVLFLGTKEFHKKILVNAAARTNGYYISSRWIPGTLTNPIEISGIWERMRVDKSTNKPVKENTFLNDFEKTKIIKPDLLVVLNTKENKIALNEAMKLRVPTIGIVDTNCDPTSVTYPIPANDDSLRSVALLTGILSKAGEKGLGQRLYNLKSSLPKEE